MGKLIFNQTPKRVYYSILPDGHIFEINAQRPSIIGDGGECWCCYFDCNPYFKDADNKLYRIFYKIDENYYEVTNITPYTGFDCYYKKNNEWKTVNSDTYYDVRSKKGYEWPKSATELPQTVYDGKTYYFDTLIKNGDSYKNGVFTPMDITPGEAKTTYGDVVMALVKDNINVETFINDVNGLPLYLKKSIPSISYTIPTDYFAVYGVLFMEKLNEAMKNVGESILEKYEEIDVESPYKGITITATIENDGTGVIKNVPNK